MSVMDEGYFEVADVHILLYRQPRPFVPANAAVCGLHTHRLYAGRLCEGEL